MPIIQSMPTVQHRPLLFMGIDPGASGGVAVIDGSSADAHAMPASEFGVWELVQSLKLRASAYTEPAGIVACIEQVTGYVGGEGNTGSSMFKFGASYGALRMALTAAGISYETVPPHQWQRALGIEKRRAGEDTTRWKNRLKQAAVELFPSIKVTKKTADALLMAEYCRRKYGGVR